MPAPASGLSELASKTRMTYLLPTYMITCTNISRHKLTYLMHLHSRDRPQAQTEQLKDQQATYAPLCRITSPRLDNRLLVFHLAAASAHPQVVEINKPTTAATTDNEPLNGLQNTWAGAANSS